MRLPRSLDWLADRDEGRAWLASLPATVEACCRRWSVQPGSPYEGSYVSLVLPVDRKDDQSMVLKVQFPHRESEHEATALARWDGHGAVRLFDHDPENHALLMERCRPGTHLADAGPDVALGVLVELLPRLSVPAGPPFASLEHEAARWAENLPAAWEGAGRPFELALVDVALELLDSLATTQGPQVLVHQDLHADNVLRAEREPWLVIDPKPLVGERELAVAPIVRSYELGHSRDAVVARLDRLCRDLDLDRERARGWTVAQTLAWSLEGSRALARHVETARWLLAA